MEPGTLVDGKYRIDRMLGSGGMATVFAATHIHLNERVAIKVLLPDLAGNPTVVERFMREARAAVRLKSEHVVRVSDVGSLPTNQPYIVMEFLDGTDLEAIVNQRGKVPYGETVDYVLQACEALAEAHSAGIVHRDIKPANLVLARGVDGTPSLKVLDFGIAKLTLADAGPNLTNTATTMGTPAFMSPEQIRGAKDVDHRGDIWSLGIVLFQMLTGSIPYYAPTYAKLVMQVMRDPTPSIASIPPGLDAVLQRCLAKDRGDRYQNVGELAQALQPFAGEPSKAAVLVQRCVGLALAQARNVTPPAGHAAQSPQRLGMATPAHGMPPMHTPAQGMPPMHTPAHGHPPMNTPAHGHPPMNTPAHGHPPMNTGTHGMVPMNTGPHMPVQTSTPAHGNPPMQQAPNQVATGAHVIAPPSKSGRQLVWIAVIAVIIGTAIGLIVLLS